jgi:hypothetical protein
VPRWPEGGIARGGRLAGACGVYPLKAAQSEGRGWRRLQPSRRKFARQHLRSGGSRSVAVAAMMNALWQSAVSGGKVVDSAERRDIETLSAWPWSWSASGKPRPGRLNGGPGEQAGLLDRAGASQRRRKGGRICSDARWPEGGIARGGWLAGALRGVPARKGSAAHRRREGKAFPTR